MGGKMEMSKPLPKPSKKDEGTRIRVRKETLKYLYMIKAETGKPLYEIVDISIKYLYENENLRSEIVRILTSSENRSSFEKTHH